VTYSFLIRFSLVGSGFNVDDAELSLWTGGTESVWLEASGALKEASQITLRGTGYQSEASAFEAGEHAHAALRLAFVRTLTSADFLERTLMGGMPDAAIALAQKAIDEAVEPGRPKTRAVVVHHRAGIQVHPADEQPISFSFSASGHAEKSAAALAEAYAVAAHEARPNRSGFLAFDLWSSAARMPSVDSRFLTFVNAIDALIHQRPTEGSELEVVERLQGVAEASQLDSASKASLNARLKDLRRESISRAGRRLAHRLDPHRYDSKNASQFFTDVYVSFAMSMGLP